MADIFREVDEEVRKDKFQQLWKRYGAYVFVVIGALILGTGFNAYWRHYQESERLEDSARFVEAMAQLTRQQTTDAINGFAALADDSGTGYAIIARLREAAARAEVGDVNGAIDAYDRLIDDDGVGDVYRDLARLLAALHLLDSGAADEIRDRIQPLMTEGSAWRFLAREIDAVLALREGRSAEARETLDALIGDVDTPAGVRARAAELVAALKSEG